MEFIRLASDIGSNCLLVYIGLTFFNIGYTEYKTHKEKKGGK